MVKTLINYDSYVLPERVKQKFDKYEYVFNPSLVVVNQYTYLAVRVFDQSSKTILALLYIWKNEKDIHEINLTDYFFEKLGLMKVADPKLFISENKVLGTINTGNANNLSHNEIVLFELEGFEVKNYYTCQYPNRTRVEKNWVFYFDKGVLFALYSLSPLTILKAVNIKENTIDFKKEYIINETDMKDCSIGTPLVELGDSFGFIAHKKYYRKRKRLYVGKVCIIKMIDGCPMLKVKNKILIHSFKSLLGEKFKFNKRLISCTYFSGICQSNGDIILSYGINDINWNIVKLKRNDLWL